MKLLLLAAALATTLAGCAARDRCAESANPAECREWVGAGGGVEDYLIGGMAGYLIASQGGQRVIVVDRGYRGPSRSLTRPLPSPRAQLAKRRDTARRAETQRRAAASKPSKPPSQNSRPSPRSRPSTSRSR